MSAEPINNDNRNTESSIHKKKALHNKTQKFRNSGDFDPKKVNSVLESIHNNISDDDELGNYRNMSSANHSENFKPLNPYDFPNNPMSMGVEKTKEGLTNLVPQPNDNDALNLQDLQSSFMNDSQVRDYYKKLVPNYPRQQQQHASHNTTDSNQVLIEKLNYMINLLEEQQDQKLDSVTEDVVLYSFLGIFIIFIVDSFTKVGKYVR